MTDTPRTVTRYTWTVTGLTPNFDGPGAMRYVRETDYDQLERENAALCSLTHDMRQVLAVGIVAAPCPTSRQWADIQTMADKLVVAIDAAKEKKP
jgi:hypothetical protein